MNKIIFCFVLNSVVSNHPPVITCHMFFGVSEGHIFWERHQVHFFSSSSPSPRHPPKLVRFHCWRRLYIGCLVTTSFLSPYFSWHILEFQSSEQFTLTIVLQKTVPFISSFHTHWKMADLRPNSSWRIWGHEIHETWSFQFFDSLIVLIICF